jgi:hypothetical protein
VFSLKATPLRARTEKDELMEKRMDCPSQPSENNQLSSAEDKPSSSSALLQEQQLFRRIMWLTLLLGVTIGICVILFGENWYILAGYIPHAFYPTSPVIYRLLSPLMLASMGFAVIIQGELQQLRKQYPIFRPGRFNLPSIAPSNLSYGLFFVLIGGFGVLINLLDQDSFLGKLILYLWVVGGLISLASTLLIPFLRNRIRAL